MFDTTAPEIRDFYDGARTLEPTEAEVARVLQRLVHRRTRGRVVRRRAIAAFALALVVLGSAFTYPASRDALDTFFSGGAIPGRGDLGGFPRWLSETPIPGSRAGAGTRRLLAEQDGQTLYAFQDASGRACLAFGDDSDTCSSTDEWERMFGNHAVLKLASGVGPTADDKVAVFGLARSSVAHVAILDGRRTVAEAPVTDGGWVIVADQGHHDTLVGLDANGKTVESLDARNWTWTFCFRESGCSP